MPWMWLVVGGLFEVGFTTSLRFVDGFRNLPWTVAFLASSDAAWITGHTLPVEGGLLTGHADRMDVH